MRRGAGGRAEEEEEGDREQREAAAVAAVAEVAVDVAGRAVAVHGVLAIAPPRGLVLRQLQAPRVCVHQPRRGHLGRA